MKIKAIIAGLLISGSAMAQSKAVFYDGTNLYSEGGVTSLVSIASNFGTNNPAMPIAGGTFTGSVYTTVDHLTQAPANNELPSATWVRSLLSFGKSAFMTTNMYPALWLPTNTTGIASYMNPVSNSMNFPVGAVGTYFATMVDTNPVAANTPLVGPATVHLHIGIGSGSPAANYSLSLKPEVYYTYSLSATNLTLGDFDADPQTWTAGQNVGKTFAISWATEVPTGIYYKVYRAKVTAKGSAITNALVGIGGADSSYILFQTAGTDASGVQANLDAHTVATGASVHGLGTISTRASNDFYLASNPSNYVTASITNGLYPSSNPSNFVDASVTNGLYPSSNPSNFVSGNFDYASNYLGYPKLTLTTNMVASSVSADTPITIPSFTNAFDGNFDTETSVGTWNADSHAYMIDLGAVYSGFVVVSGVLSNNNTAGTTFFRIGSGGTNSVISGGIALGTMWHNAYASSLTDGDILHNAGTAGAHSTITVKPFIGSRIIIQGENSAALACSYRFREIIVYAATNGFSSFGGTLPR